VKIDGKWTVKTPFYNRSGSLSDKVMVGSERRIVPGVFVLEWYDSHGKRQRRTLGTSLSDAQTELEYKIRKLADIAEGRRIGESHEGKHHFDFATRAYYSSLCNKEREEKTIKAIQQNLETVAGVHGSLLHRGHQTGGCDGDLRAGSPCKGIFEADYIRPLCPYRQFSEVLLQEVRLQVGGRIG
jgi:hypothetical protein